MLNYALPEAAGGVSAEGRVAQQFRFQWVMGGERAEFSFLSRVPGLSDAHRATT